MDEFSRSRILLGEKMMNKIRNSHVLVLGLGGVGSYVAEALARAGVGHLTLVDNDTVSLTNINRQLYALHSTLGMPKTEVAKARILDINPDCQVTVKSVFYLPENREEIFCESYDYIADAIDTVTAKIDLAVQANDRGIPIISCMGAGNKLDPSAFRIGDIFETKNCPICRVMRRELRKRDVERLTVVFSEEKALTPAAMKEEMSIKRQIPGSVSFVPPVAGLLMAGEIIRKIVYSKSENEENSVIL